MRFFYDFESLTYEVVLEALDREIQRLGTGGGNPNPPPQQSEKEMRYWELVEFRDAVRTNEQRSEDE